MSNIKRLLTSLILALSLLLISCDDEALTLSDIPEYCGHGYVAVNDNIPFFTEDEICDTSFESYSPRDPLGRCGAAVASIGKDIMPTEERDESLSAVTPSGWTYRGVSNNRYYESISSYVYNRCHLIGYQLTGENANADNLITGTRYFNIEGMLPFENEVADFIEETEMHVMYRVTPMYEGYELVARGVLLEALSVEDGGEGVCFCVFVYNVQPGIEINYVNGVNRQSGDIYVDLDKPLGTNEHFVLNSSSKKYHTADCYHAKTMSEDVRIDFNGRLDGLMLLYPEYTPCSVCFENDK